LESLGFNLESTESSTAAVGALFSSRKIAQEQMLLLMVNY